MKIIIAPDSFKESLSAECAAMAIEDGFRAVFPELEAVRLPVADGGEGTVDALIAATGGHRIDIEVTDPQGHRVRGFYGVNGKGDCAVIEMAAASGLMLVPAGQRDPLAATSFGTGELIRHALDGGIRHIILGIGGSATVDGGIGMVQALGGRFTDAQGIDLPWGGAALAQLAAIDLSQLDPRLAQCRIEVACDVENPLTGPCGAAAVFGPQKGASVQDVQVLDAALAHLAAVIFRHLGVNVLEWPGGGAAGGMGVAARLFLRGNMRSGIDIIMDAIGLDEAMQGATLVITGEGRLDQQTINGKAPVGVARLAQRYHVPVIGLAGILGEGVEVVHQHGLEAVFSILPRLAPLETVLEQGEENLRYAAQNLARVYRLGMKASS
ncbi:glycerate kinase [Rahnella aceris]|jgi:glycerate kinase|uniref:Glycerate kinase n=2 Tax=Rahnella sp. (strain Y9602) TaxID=2703885 RepID=A0A0H3F7J5_RAHSY|nr:glycerate kinase [Rahnella aceris]AZP40597.1 glycerate kinase [Rahnella aquatilis]ADW71929.1 glycerate kinase [Rahnella aceris]AZP44939.1 glycerate kinase [Rahnella aquatilis]NIA90231.1 glycerate kinase [Rahnella aceris]QBJ09528.1 glycerate kinase [Rahnella aquatilis]